MPVRIVTTVQTGNGESIQCDIPQWNPVTGVNEHDSVSEMLELTTQVLSLTDARLMEMNIRHLEARGLRKYFEPAVWIKIVSILDILSGRDTADNVARRWYSEVEETQELEAGRVAALNGDTND